MRFFKYGFSVLQLYTRVTTLHSCYMKIALIFSQSDKRNFFHVYYSQIHGSCKLVVFETLTSAYEHQIALETMLLPIQIDNMYKRKTN